MTGKQKTILSNIQDSNIVTNNFFYWKEKMQEQNRQLEEKKMDPQTLNLASIPAYRAYDWDSLRGLEKVIQMIIYWLVKV